MSFAPPGVSTTTGGPAACDHLAEHLSANLPLAQVGVAVSAGAGRVARVVRVQQVDLPDDLQHTWDRVGQLLAGRMSVAGVEAEADVDARVGRGDRFPELGEGVEAAGHRVLAAGGVLDQDGNFGFEHLQRPRPAADAVGDAVVGVSGVDDHGGRSNVSGGFAGLLEDLARPVADVVARRADVDQVGRVNV